MTLKLNTIFALVSALVGTSICATSAFAQPSAGSDISSSKSQFNTTLPRPSTSSFVLIPAIAYGGSGAGSGSATTTPDDRRSFSSAQSYEAGLLAEMGRGAFVFQTGLMYLNHGLAVSEDQIFQDGMSSHGDATLSLKYLGVPLVAKGRARIANGVRMAGRIGVEPVVFMGADFQGTATSTAAGYGTSTYATNGSVGPSDSSNIRPLNIYALIGGGPEFRVANNQSLRVEALYERMLLPVALRGDTNDVTIHAWNAMLSYGIGF